MPRGSRSARRGVLVVVLREEGLFGRRVVEGWERGRLRVLEVKVSGGGQGGLRTLGPWSCTRDAYIFRAPSSLSESIPASDERSRSHASPHAFASKPSRRTTIFPQLSQPAGTTMRSRSSVFGLWTNGNGLRTGAAVLSSAPSGEGAGGTNRTWSAYWRRTLSVVGCGVV
jgi:hypothetical protein